MPPATPTSITSTVFAQLVGRGRAGISQEPDSGHIGTISILVRVRRGQLERHETRLLREFCDGGYRG